MELLILLAVLQIGDVLTTLRFLKAGIPEANPVARWLFEAVGVVPAILVLKILFLTVAFLALGQPYGKEIIAGFCFVYAYVVYRNYKVVPSEK